MKEPGRRGPKTECHGLDRGRADTWGPRNHGQSREETVSDSPRERVPRGEADAGRPGSLKATQSPAIWGSGVTVDLKRRSLGTGWRGSRDSPMGWGVGEEAKEMEPGKNRLPPRNRAGEEARRRFALSAH